jgi:hypothetical protein
MKASVTAYSVIASAAKQSTTALDCRVACGPSQ